MGKNAFLSFPVPPFFSTFFLVFGQSHKKRVKKEVERQKNGWEDVERSRRVVLPLSKLSNLARFRFFYYLKAVLDPVPMPFLPHSKPNFPLSKPIPGLSCIAHLSYLDTYHL